LTILSIEVGTDTYISTVTADAYSSARGNSGWDALTTSEKEQALVKSTSWLDSKFKNLWKGVRADVDQVLAWPRYAVYDEDGFSLDDETIPTAVKNACAEMAYKIACENENPFEDEEQGIASEKVGPISINYDGRARQKKYAYIRGILAGVTKGANNPEVVRA